MLGRWGGEEFLIICPKTNIKNVAILAESIRENIEKNKLKNIDNITVTLGIAEMTAHDNFNTIISRADSGLFLEKNNGRNRVEQA